MPISIKTTDEIQKMKIAGKLAADVLEMISPMIYVGQKTGELNKICHEYIVNEQKAIPAPLNYHGFPKSICTSVNHVVCHGIPSYKEKLNDGDIINIDITVIKDGYHGDTSKTFFVGRPDKEKKKLVDVLTKGTPTNDVKMQNFVYITFNAPYLFEVHTINFCYGLCNLFPFPSTIHTHTHKSIINTKKGFPLKI